MWGGNVLCVRTKSWERLLVGVDQQVVLQGVSTGAEATSGATSVPATPVFSGAGPEPAEVDNPLQTEAAHSTGSIEAGGPVAACT